MSLDPKAEDGYFAYARYLDQHMRDARERQERVRAARAEAQARAKDSGASNLHYDVNKDDRLGGRSKCVPMSDQQAVQGHLRNITMAQSRQRCTQCCHTACTLAMSFTPNIR